MTKIAALIRFFGDSKQSLGTIMAMDGAKLFVAKTLELSDKNNQNNISCIPKGTYTCKYTRSTRLSLLTQRDYYTYEVLNVPNRSGIRIHSANFYTQIKGCIALGDSHKDLNADQSLDVVHSGNTTKAFEEFMGKEDFILTIK
jgi:hypothetical protein